MILRLKASCSSSGRAANDRTEGVRITTFHPWEYSHYFVVVEEGDKNMRACSCSHSNLRHNRLTGGKSEKLLLMRYNKEFVDLA